MVLRATLDEGLKFSVQWNRTILLAESHKLDPWPFDEGPRPKSGKLRLNLHGTILEGNSISSGWKREFKGEIMIGRTKMQARSKAGSNLRIQFASNKSKLVPRNFDLGPYLKWVLLLNFRFQECNQLNTYINVEINYLLGHHKLASSLYMCFYNILTMCSRLSINEKLINHW